MIIFFINQYWSSEKRLLNVIINKLFIHAFVLLLRLFLQREGGGWAGERSASLPLWSALVWSVSDIKAVLSASIRRTQICLRRTKQLRCPLQSTQRCRLQRKRALRRYHSGIGRCLFLSRRPGQERALRRYRSGIGRCLFLSRCPGQNGNVPPAL